MLERVCREGLARGDGETSVAAIAAALGEDERAVWLALHQLTKAQLLTEAIAFPPDMSAAKSRREIGARLGLGAAAVVASIVAPMPAQAASCIGWREARQETLTAVLARV